jgi:4-amino-4-deoxy-L-arabinose transferase-like glycosyltransferase
LTRAAAAASLALLAALAAFLVFESGSRGYFPLDQSNVFDGGYRLLRGQVPYRDFLMPVGPVTFLIQAALFRLCGVGYGTFILHSAIVNAFAALLTVACVRRVFPGAVLPAWLAGLATAAWFYPPFGTPVFDQTALFCHLLALLALLPALAEQPAPARADRSALLSGVLSGLAFLSKQNAGALSAACLALLLLGAARRRARPLAHFVAGFALCGALFGLWLLAYSEPKTFYRHFFAIPLAEGLRRAGSAEFGAALLADVRRDAPTLLLVLLGPLLSLLGLALAGRGSRLPHAARLGFCVCLSLALLQWLFIRVTSNLPQNAFGLAALATALALLAACESLGWRRRAAQAALLALVLIPFALAGRELARSRRVHEFWFATHYRNAPRSRALAPALWAASDDDPRALRVQDIDALVDFLREARAPFFVFPDCVVLYGLAGQEPPQPLVWFHPGLTYSHRYDAELDRRVVDGLERHGVRYVVLESVSFLGTEKRLSHFPLLKAYLERFRATRRYGIFELLERSG